LFWPPPPPSVLPPSSVWVVELGSPATPFQEEEGRQKLIFNSTGLSIRTTRRPNGKQNGGSLTISLLSRSPIWHDTPNSYFRISPSDVSGRREREETTPGETLQGRRPSHTDLAAVSFTFFVFLIFTIYLFIFIVIFLNLFLIPAVFVFPFGFRSPKNTAGTTTISNFYFYLFFYYFFINRLNSLLKNR
jgi:hypothetical protein